MTDSAPSFSDSLKPFLANLWPVFAVILMTLLVFHDTVYSMARIWSVNETYSHGYIILPIMIWLLWQHRFDIALARGKTDYRLFPLLLGSLLVWVLAELVGVQALAQAAVVTTMITAIWVVTGIRMALVIFFPVVFLLFMVPVGDFLIPPMMEFTATFTVELLRLTGIPVYREGMFFSIPSGNWSVVEACSGVRYIIASFVLGVLYAFLNYRALYKQLLFILASLLVPILANGLRAYMIVMIGHLSNMELATGVDHLVYGWVFFGVVMLILFAIGAIWRDDMSPPEAGREQQAGCFPDRPATYRVLGVIFVTLLVPAIFVASQHQEVVESDQAFLPPLQADGWSQCADYEVNDWRPGMVGASAITAAHYCRGGDKVTLFVGYYPHQQQGHEVVNQLNALNPVEGEDFTASKIQTQAFIPQQIGTHPLDVEASIVARHGQVYRTWRLYRVGSRMTSKRVQAKLFEMQAKLLEGRSDALFIVVAAPIDSSAQAEQADQLLADYTQGIVPLIEAHADSLLTE